MFIIHMGTVRHSEPHPDVHISVLACLRFSIAKVKSRVEITIVYFFEAINVNTASAALTSQ